MRVVLLILIFLFYTNCSKPKTVLICGDHACINNAEAEQYFEENLSLEVKIIDKNREGKIDLVKLNLTDNSDDNREVAIESKTETESLVKILTNDEIKKVKKEIKIKKKEKLAVKKMKIKKKSSYKSKKIVNKNVKIVKRNNINNKDNVVDVCTLIKKCNIKEISKFLLKQNKKKNFPDITTRE